MRNGVLVAGVIILALAAYFFWPSREAALPPAEPVTTQEQTNDG